MSIRNKILDVRSPLNERYFVALVCRRFFGIPIWFSVKYYTNNNKLCVSWRTFYVYRHDNAIEAELSIKKYYEWKDGRELKHIYKVNVQ